VRENEVPAGVVLGVATRRHTGLPGVGVFVVPTAQTRSPPSVSSIALVQSGSERVIDVVIGATKSIFPSPSLSMPSEH